jgi:hypothetical protein
MKKEELYGITVRFTQEQINELKKIAERETRPTANLITWIVLQYLNQDGERDSRK